MARADHGQPEDVIDLQEEGAGGVHHDQVLQWQLGVLHLPVIQELAGAAGGKDGQAHATLKNKNKMNIFLCLS